MVTDEQKARIIELYHDGETFRQAAQSISVNGRRTAANRAYYEGIATAGTLSREQARRVFFNNNDDEKFDCDPATKPCRKAIQFISREVGVTANEVMTVLREHLTNNPPTPEADS